MATQAEILKFEAANRLENYNRFWYPGRGIVMGMSEDSNFLIQIYWITGRSENSQNRIFVDTGDGMLATAPADPTKVKDPSLIIYNAMLEDINLIRRDSDPICYGIYGVSNGAQTEDLVRLDFEDFISEWSYEPDEPNFTPRINGILSLVTPHEDSKAEYGSAFLIFKKSPFGEKCDIALYAYEYFDPGYGYCITTYARPTGEMALINQKQSPLISFSGEPYLMALPGSPEDILDSYWEAMHPDNRISVAVKAISIETGQSFVLLKNKHEVVSV